MEINIVEQAINPDLPRVIDNEQMVVYVPTVGRDSPGIAKFDDMDFIIDLATGTVTLKNSERNKIKNANPLETISYVKLNPSEFEYDEPFGDSPKAAVKLRRDSQANNPMIAPSLVMLSNIDFTTSESDRKLTTHISWPSNPFEDSSKLGFKFSPTDFSINSSKIIGINYPIAAADKYGLVKIKSEGSYLNIKDGYLDADESRINDYISTSTLIVPNYPDNTLVKPYIDVDPMNSKKVVAKRQAYYKKDNSEVPFGTVFDSDTMYYRTLMKIDKLSLGLGNVLNKNVDVEIGGHNKNEQAHTDLFSKKLSIVDYDKDKAKFNSRVDEIDKELGDVQITLNKNKYYMGFYTNPIDSGKTDEEYVNTVPELDPDKVQGFTNRSYIYLTNTATVWSFNVDTNMWYDTGKSQDAMEVLLQAKATSDLGPAQSILQKDGIASYSAGVASDFWAPIDHVHPLRDDIFLYKKADGTAVNIVVNGDSAPLENASDIVIDVQLVNVSKEVHDWNGQYPGGEFKAGKAMRIWSGTSDEYVQAFGGNVPDNVLALVTDDTESFEGEIVDKVALDAAITSLNNMWISNAVEGSQSLFLLKEGKPTWESFNKNDYILKEIPDDINLQQGILTYQNKKFALLTETSTAGENAVKYYTVSLLDKDGYNKPIDLGSSGGMYATLGNVSDSIVSIIDNKYIVALNSENVTVSTAISNLSGDIATNAGNIESISKTLNDLSISFNKYPNAPSVENTYVISASKDSSGKVTNSWKPVSTVLSEKGCILSTDAISFKNGTNPAGEDITGTYKTISTLLKSASNVYNSSDSTELRFWVGSKVEYDSPQLVKDAHTLYFCIE